jgi:hypothetical protein
MGKCVKVAMDRIEESPAYQERHSQWIDRMSDDLRRFVAKAKMVRIVARKTDDKYTVVTGHHLLKAARECGLNEAYVHVIETDGAGRESSGEDLIAFRLAVEEILDRAEDRSVTVPSSLCRH